MQRRTTHKWRRDRYSTSSVPCLDHRGVQPGDRVRKTVEVARHKSVRGEVIMENVEELHKTSGDVLRQSIFALEWHGGTDPAQKLGTQRCREWSAGSCLPHPEKSGGKRVKLRTVEFVELSILIDENTSLLWQLRPVVVAYRVVSEVVEDLQGQEEARRVHVGIPVENRTVYNLNMVDVSTRVERVLQILTLELSESGRNFDDLKLGPLIHIMVGVSDEIKDVEHQCSISSTHFVYYEVMVWIQCQFVVRHQVSGDRLSIVGTKQLCWCVP